MCDEGVHTRTVGGANRLLDYECMGGAVRRSLVHRGFVVVSTPNDGAPLHSVTTTSSKAQATHASANENTIHVPPMVSMDKIGFW